MRRDDAGGKARVAEVRAQLPPPKPRPAVSAPTTSTPAEYVHPDHSAPVEPKCHNPNCDAKPSHRVSISGAAPGDYCEPHTVALLAWWPTWDAGRDLLATRLETR